MEKESTSGTQDEPQHGGRGRSPGSRARWFKPGHPGRRDWKAKGQRPPGHPRGIPRACRLLVDMRKVYEGAGGAGDPPRLQRLRRWFNEDFGAFFDHLLRLEHAHERDVERARRRAGQR